MEIKIDKSSTAHKVALLWEQIQKEDWFIKFKEESLELITEEIFNKVIETKRNAFITRYYEEQKLKNDPDCLEHVTDFQFYQGGRFELVMKINNNKLGNKIKFMNNFDNYSNSLIDYDEYYDSARKIHDKLKITTNTTFSTVSETNKILLHLKEIVFFQIIIWLTNQGKKVALFSLSDLFSKITDTFNSDKPTNSNEHFAYESLFQYDYIIIFDVVAYSMKNWFIERYFMPLIAHTANHNLKLILFLNQTTDEFRKQIINATNKYDKTVGIILDHFLEKANNK